MAGIYVPAACYFNSNSNKTMISVRNETKSMVTATVILGLFIGWFLITSPGRPEL